MTFSSRILQFAAGFVALVGLASVATAQDTSADEASARAEQATPPLPEVEALEDLRPGRLTLLREGSTLLRARGAITRGEHGTWLFELAGEAAEGPAIRLHLLPSRQLAEMERLSDLEAGVIERSIFELSGEVFVYRGRNFLLPLFAPRLISASETRTVEQDDESEGNDESAADNEAGELQTGMADDYVKQIMRDLEESVGNVARAAPGGEGDIDELENLVRDGERIINRRGRLRKDERSAWIFVFEADASGLADPPMTVLPCLMLEDLVEKQQAAARSSGARQPLLITGLVTKYHGRNYLLPSMYRMPHNATPISR